MCDYRIYDNEEEQWLGVSFADYDDAEDYVTNVLMDADFEIYSIYQRMCGI